MKKFVIVLLSFCFSLVAFSQHQITMRDSLTVKIIVDPRNSYTLEVESSPYLMDDLELLIYPGENLYLELEIQKNKVVGLQVVSENKHPERTILISFSQVVRRDTHQGMSIRIMNPLPNRVRFSAEMMGTNYLWKRVKTQTFPAATTSTNILPYPMMALLIKDIKLKRP